MNIHSILMKFWKLALAPITTATAAHLRFVFFNFSKKRGVAASWVVSLVSALSFSLSQELYAAESAGDQLYVEVNYQISNQPYTTPFDGYHVLAIAGSDYNIGSTSATLRLHGGRKGETYNLRLRSYTSMEHGAFTTSSGVFQFYGKYSGDGLPGEKYGESHHTWADGWDVVELFRGEEALKFKGGDSKTLRIAFDTTNSFEAPWLASSNGASIELFYGCPMDSDECSSCRDGPPSSGSFGSNSIDGYIGLGPSRSDGLSGTIRLKVSDLELGNDLYTPSALRFDGIDAWDIGAGWGMITSATGSGRPQPRQLRLPSCFVDIVQTVSMPNGKGFELRFYQLSDIGSHNSSTGLYPISSGATPYNVWKFENVGNSAGTSLSIKENLGASNEVEYSYTYSSNTVGSNSLTGWALNTKVGGVSLKNTSVINTFDSGGSKIASLRTTQDAAAVSQQSVYCEYDVDGFKTLETKAHGHGTLASTTTYEYSGYGSSKYIKKQQDWTGNWTYSNSYNAKGQRTRWVDQYKNNPYTGSWPDLINRMHELSESTDLDVETETLAGVVVSRRWKKLEDFGTIYSGENNYRKITESVATDLTISSPSWSDASNLKTVTYLYDSDNATIGHVKNSDYLVIRPDGQATLTKYFTATEVVNSQTVVTDITETWSGAPSTTSVSGYTVTITAGTKTVEEKTPGGQIVYRRVSDIATSTTIEERQAVEFDSFGRVTEYKLFGTNGYFEKFSYSCCGLEWKTDMHGVKTEYTYDALGRVKTETSFANGTGDQPPVRREFIYDALGRKTKTLIGPIGGQLTEEEHHYNLAGELDWTKDGLARQTSYATAKVGDYIVHTITAPDTSTKVEKRYQDGSLYEKIDTVGPTVTRGMRYAYATDASGNRSVTETPLDGSTAITAGAIVRWTDAAGRQWKVVSPSPTGSGNAEQIRYYATPSQTTYKLGQLYKITRTGRPDFLYTYDSLGRVAAEGEDIDSNGALTASGGTDRIREFLYSFASTDEHVTTRHWNASATYLTTTRRTNIRLSTLRSLTEPGQDYLYYNAGINRTAATFTRTESRGSLSTTLTSKYGRLASVVKSGSTQLGAVTYAYDSYGRLISQTDARNGSTTYTYDAAGRVASITTPDPDTSANDVGRRPQTVTYAYADLGSLEGYGRRETVTRRFGGIFGTAVEETVSEYYPTGELRRTYGASTAPSLYSYDFAGRTKTLTTWRDFNSSTGVGVGFGDTTTWSYYAAGFLQSKRDASNKGPDYTYDSAGRLKTREWARIVSGVRLKTTYNYAPATGDLTAIDYSDSTTDVAYSGHDRLGRPSSITDASGTRALVYSTIYTLSEQYTAGALSSYKITAPRGAADRIDYLLAEGAGASEYYIHYFWGEGNRLTGLFRSKDFDDPIDGYFFHEYYIDYLYEANSDLVSSISYSFYDSYGEGFSGIPVIQTRSYDYLNRAKEFYVDAEYEGGRILAYGYNDRNQRTRSTDASGNYWSYSYDSDSAPRGVGQVASAVRKDSGGTTVPGFDFSYAYDPMGNRTAAIANGQATSYYQNSGGTGSSGGNVLNQYGSRLSGATTETFSYDDDGNLLSDGKWAYTWDAENRLSRLETSVAAYTGGAPRKRIEYAYDDRGRRALKSVFTWNTSTTAFNTTPASRIGFLYHDWNLLQEVNLVASTPTVIRRYYWGLDLSGTLQGAGGVGGLVAAELDYYGYGAAWPMAVLSDANGNVSDLAGIGGFYDYGLWLGHYEYDPFGKSFSDGAVFALNNPFRFSTKYIETDAAFGGNEVGLLYYGYRYYIPSTGRWLSRDPIEEQGGANLYAMTGNNLITYVDILGLEIFTKNVEFSWFDDIDNTGGSSASATLSWKCECAGEFPNISEVSAKVNQPLMDSLSGMGIESIKGKTSPFAVDVSQGAPSIDKKNGANIMRMTVTLTFKDTSAGGFISDMANTVLGSVGVGTKIDLSAKLDTEETEISCACACQKDDNHKTH